MIRAQPSSIFISPCSLPQDNTYSTFRIQLRCHFLWEAFSSCPSGVSQVFLLSTLRTFFLTVIIPLSTVHFYFLLTCLLPPDGRGYAQGLAHLWFVFVKRYGPYNLRCTEETRIRGHYWLTPGPCSVYCPTQMLVEAQESIWTSRPQKARAQVCRSLEWQMCLHCPLPYPWQTLLMDHNTPSH